MVDICEVYNLASSDFVMRFDKREVAMPVPSAASNVSPAVSKIYLILSVNPVLLSLLFEGLEALENLLFAVS